MSALLFVLQRDQIDILVDTKAIGCAAMAKVWPLVHLPAIICGRGPAASDDLLLDPGSSGTRSCRTYVLLAPFRFRRLTLPR
jgi:hypothetical protein